MVYSREVAFALSLSVCGSGWTVRGMKVGLDLCFVSLSGGVLRARGLKGSGTDCSPLPCTCRIRYRTADKSCT